MKRILLPLLAGLLSLPVCAQPGNVPQEALRKGYGVQKTVYAAMDADPAAEEVLVFGHDNGHWPEFDLFKSYVAVIDSRTREIKYLSDEFVTERYNIKVADLDGDGFDELYYRCIDMDRFATAPDGYNPQFDYLYRKVSLQPEPSPAAPRKDKIRTLVIAGQDGSHWSEGAAECVRQMLENSGLFSVDVLITPDWGEDMSSFKPKFSKYGLVVIDYGGVEWSDCIKRSFESYVEKGGGVVFIHSSIIPMENWPEYNKMTGLGAWNGRDGKWGPYLYLQDGKYVYDYSPGWAGHHGLQHHVFVDHPSPEHPIVKGLPRRWHHYKDEIYTRLRGPAENIEVVATTHDSGRDEPVMWTVTYGKGRIFTDVLGHCGSDPNMIYSRTCTGYQVTFLRGCEWAATGTVTQRVPPDFPDEDHYTLRKDFKAPVL